MRTQTASELHHIASSLNYLLFGHPELVLHVNRAGGIEGVNPGPLRVLNRIPGSSNVLLVAARETANDWKLTVVVDGVSDLLRDHLDGFEVVLGCGWEAPGDCSPSRRVVSKMQTYEGSGMWFKIYGGRRREESSD
ncbi:hypothetical protein LR48_Vigan02g020000 [Vigna angularis]|uniref:Uncharacterized protein n=1 Tax=Phaseolus angularis TaxID=3914 RepID=A0A0L9TU28_PHAAN|nr:hypothetical protein LR48_Vigan02g020000 [Vigna angularis]